MPFAPEDLRRAARTYRTGPAVHMNKRIAIACQGGGSQCAFVAGALKTLFNRRIEERFKIVGLSGTYLEGVATITLNRPGAANALSMELAASIGHAFSRVRHDERVRAWQDGQRIPGVSDILQQAGLSTNYA